VPNYLVESYVPKVDELDWRRAALRAREAAAAVSDVGYVRSLFVESDETCFHVFEAPSLEAVVEASRRAGLTDSRIVPVLLE
jgi:sirohydrochlorin ferrochelatase